VEASLSELRWLLSVLAPLLLLITGGVCYWIGSRALAPIDGMPGIYLLRGEVRTPLFIGRTLDLGRRLGQHADCPAISDHVDQVAILSGSDLPGEEYLAAFKEDLVRRYGPRWNMDLVGLHSVTLD
jgi:hypothetical protein